MDKEKILDWAIDLMNEEREKNNDIATEIVEKIFDDIDMSQYEDIDTVVTVFVRVRKWTHISSYWWAHEMRLTRFHDRHDLHMAKVCMDELYMTPPNDD